MFSIKKVNEYPEKLIPETLYYIEKTPIETVILLVDREGEIISECLDTEFLEKMDLNGFLDEKVDKIQDMVLSKNDFTNELKNKLEQLKEDVTVNRPDNQLLLRENHTGQQDISTITGLADLLSKSNGALSGRIASTKAEAAAMLNEIPRQKVIFNEWYKFSHKGSNNFPAIPSETTAWSYNDSAQTFSNTTNSDSFIGVISKDYFDEYRLLTRLYITSKNDDDDNIGVVIAFHKDPVTGKEHTLSVLRSPGGTDQLYQVWKNFRQNENPGHVTPGGSANSKIVYNGNHLVTWGNGESGALSRAEAKHPENNGIWWYNVGTVNRGPVNSTLLRVNRIGDYIEIYTSQWKSGNVIDRSTKITIDLSEDPDLHIFRGKRRYGFCSYSQATSAWDVKQFVTSVDTIYDLANKKIYEHDGEQWLESPTLNYQDIPTNTIFADPRTGRLFLKHSESLVTEIETTNI